MTAKDFILIAATLNKAIRGAAGDRERYAYYQLCFLFATELRKTNRRFDADRWYQACFANTEYAKEVVS